MSNRKKNIKVLLIIQLTAKVSLLHKNWQKWPKKIFNVSMKNVYIHALANNLPICFESLKYVRSP